MNDDTLYDPSPRDCMIVGVDPSLRMTGIAIWSPLDNGKVVSISADKNDPNASLSDRIVRIGNLARDIDHIIKMSTCATSVHVFIETLMLSKQIGGESNAYLHGILRYLLATRVELHDVTGPTRQKWAAGDSPRRDKDVVLARAIKLGQEYGITIDNNDEADAFWLCDLGRHLITGKGWSPLTSYRAAVLDKLRK